ncbi:hypothetical protein DTL42_18650 [Bremerella cremea]|uniref:Uncharacterized protein n=1 Tax=Bremerella cremea TaxID=1031537 RepID=A0A368KQ33_9BACT|nr:hypothetical protein [Bremerella cremea]RCS44004.1 hypothetical protein DTL42_18650 [Bremerella cremea]
MAKKANKNSTSRGKPSSGKPKVPKDSRGRDIANRAETLTAAEIESLAREFYKVYQLLHDCASFMSLKQIDEIQAIVSGLKKKARESQKLANSQIGRKVDAWAIEMGIEDRLGKFSG